MNSTSRVIFRWTMVASLTAVAIFALSDEPTSWLIAPVLWGVMIAASMRKGLESADREAWERKPSKTAGFAHAAILTLILAPSMAAWFGLGMLPALAAVWMTILAMSATFTLAKWCRGPIQDPRSTSPERGSTFGGKGLV